MSTALLPIFGRGHQKFTFIIESTPPTKVVILADSPEQAYDYVTSAKFGSELLRWDPKGSLLFQRVELDETTHSAFSQFDLLA